MARARSARLGSDVVLRVGQGDDPTLEQRTGRQVPRPRGRNALRMTPTSVETRYYRRPQVDHLRRRNGRRRYRAIAQARRGLHDRIEDGLHVGGRAADDASTSPVAV